MCCEVSDDFETRVTKQLADVSAGSSKLGVFVSRTNLLATVNLGASTVTIPFESQTLPPPGHPVVVEVRNEKLVVTGPARPLPGTGTITATGSPRATVTAWGVAYVLRYNPNYTPVVSHLVGIVWDVDGGTITGQVSAVSDVVVPNVNVPPAMGKFHPDPFLAIDSGSRDAGGFDNRDVWASVSYTGAWWYGSVVKDTIPDTARILSALIYLNPRQISGGAPLIQVHTEANRVGGVIPFTGATYALPSRSGWEPIPLTFIDYLKVNSGGIGMNHGGYTIFRGTQSDGLSGALDITWEV